MSQKFAYKATTSKSGLTILEEEVCGGWIGRTIELMDWRTKLAESTWCFDVPTMVQTKILFFWGVTAYKSLRSYWCFVHLQGFGTPMWLIMSIGITLPLFIGVKNSILFSSRVFLHSVLLKNITSSCKLRWSALLANKPYLVIFGDTASCNPTAESNWK